MTITSQNLKTAKRSIILLAALGVAVSCKKMVNSTQPLTVEIRDYASKNIIAGISVELDQFKCPALPCVSEKIGDRVTGSDGRFGLPEAGIYSLVSKDPRYFSPYSAQNLPSITPSNPPGNSIWYLMPSSRITFSFHPKAGAMENSNGSLEWSIIDPELALPALQHPYVQNVYLPRDTSLTLEVAGGADNLLHLTITRSASPRWDSTFHIIPTPFIETSVDIKY